MVPTAIFPKLIVGVPAARAYAALASLADHATGKVTTTEDQTAVEAAMSKRQVNEGIRILISAGWITRLTRGQQGRPSVYQLHAEPTRGHPRVGGVEGKPQHADSRVMEEIPTRGELRVDGFQDAETRALKDLYPSVTRGNPRPSSVGKKEEEDLPPPRVKGIASFASDVGASEDEVNLLIANVRRDRPHVQVPLAWLRSCHENGDLAAMLDDLRTAQTVLAPSPASDWCGHCDATTRYIEVEVEPRDFRPARCPTCHPQRRAAS